MFKNASYADSVSGVAEVTSVVQSGPTIQVGLKDIGASSGTITLSVIAGTNDSYEDVQDGEFLITSASTHLITGRVQAVKATSDNTGDSFTLEVIS